MLTKFDSLMQDLTYNVVHEPISIPKGTKKIQLTHCWSMMSTGRAAQSGLKAKVHPVDTNILFITSLQAVPIVAARIRTDGVLLVCLVGFSFWPSLGFNLVYFSSFIFMGRGPKYSEHQQPLIIKNILIFYLSKHFFFWRWKSHWFFGTFTFLKTPTFARKTVCTSI